MPGMLLRKIFLQFEKLRVVRRNCQAALDKLPAVGYLQIAVGVFGQLRITIGNFIDTVQGGIIAFIQFQDFFVVGIGTLLDRRGQIVLVQGFFRLAGEFCDILLLRAPPSRPAGQRAADYPGKPADLFAHTVRPPEIYARSRPARLIDVIFADPFYALPGIGIFRIDRQYLAIKPEGAILLGIGQPLFFPGLGSLGQRNRRFFFARPASGQTARFTGCSAGELGRSFG